MNSLVLVFCLFGAALAQNYNFVQQPVQYKQLAYQQPISYAQPKLARPIAIVRQSSAFNYDGNFNYDFQSENGISNQATGSVKNLGQKEQSQVMQGSYSYTAPDGTPITTNWYADETGFHAEGAHLPTPPPLPEAIARSLEYIRSLPPSKEEQKYY